MKTTETTKTILAALAILALGSIFAAESEAAEKKTLNVTVADRETRQPIPGASVSVIYRRQVIASSTARYGKFRFQLAVGTYTLRASARGYSSRQVTQSVSKRGSRVTVYLKRR